MNFKDTWSCLVLYEVSKIGYAFTQCVLYRKLIQNCNEMNYVMNRQDFNTFSRRVNCAFKWRQGYFLFGHYCTKKTTLDLLIDIVLLYIDNNRKVYLAVCTCFYFYLYSERPSIFAFQQCILIGP